MAKAAKENIDEVRARLEYVAGIDVDHAVQRAELGAINFAAGRQLFEEAQRIALECREFPLEVGTQDTLNDEHKPLLKKIRSKLKDRVESVNVSQRLVDSPACVVTAAQDLGPQLRRMLEASGQTVPESKPILEINVDHPLVARLSAEPDDRRFDELSNIVLDHALLAEGAQLGDPAEYVRRMNNYLLDLEKDKE